MVLYDSCRYRLAGELFNQETPSMCKYIMVEKDRTTFELLAAAYLSIWGGSVGRR